MAAVMSEVFTSITDQEPTSSVVKLSAEVYYEDVRPFNMRHSVTL